MNSWVWVSTPLMYSITHTFAPAAQINSTIYTLFMTHRLCKFVDIFSKMSKSLTKTKMMLAFTKNSRSDSDIWAFFVEIITEYTITTINENAL